MSALLALCGQWHLVSDADGEIAELYATETDHTHNQHVRQLQPEFSIDIPFPHNPTAGTRLQTIQIVQNQSAQIKGQCVFSRFCLWDGAVCLAHFLAQHSTHLGLGGAKTIELGSGSGLVSLSLALHQPAPFSITMTDQESLLKHLARNLALHAESHPEPTQRRGAAAASARSGKRTVGGARGSFAGSSSPAIEVQELEWATAPRDPLARHPALRAIAAASIAAADDMDSDQQYGWDLVVASDCVYNEHLVGPFVTTIVGLLEARTAAAADDGKGRRTPIALVCFELRSDLVTLAFLEALQVIGGSQLVEV
ncbi:hypothetical protein BC828DRAFT_406903 [Blastocladiella britannica]|nr:hypothetical protein BC828DRAFT_406903 [Blastocladiella britannica]